MEGITRTVERYCCPSAIGVKIVLMGSGLAVKGKAVSDKGRDEFSGGETPEPSIVNSHWLNSHSYLRFGGHLHFIGWSIGQWFSVLNKALYHHLDYLLNVAKSFFLGIAPGSSSFFEKSWTVGRPNILIGLNYYPKDVGFHLNYPFIPVSVIPSMKSRWVKKKRIKMGKTIRLEAAMSFAQSR